MNKKKQLLIIVLFLSLLLIITSTTYAYWKWRSNEAEKTNVTFTTGSGFSCSADGGGNITQNDATLIPTYCTNSPYVITREITTSVLNSTSNTIYLNLWLKINDISTELSNSNYFNYALTTSPNICTPFGNRLLSGTFYGKNNTTDNKVNILADDSYPISANKTYYLHIWLDTAETNNATQNQTFNFELEGECSTDGEYTSSSRLTSEYQQVEYIQSTGTQYIDTKYKPGPTTGIYTDFQLTSTTKDQYLFGLYSNSRMPDTFSYGFFSSSAYRWWYSYSDEIKSWSGENSYDTNISSDLNRHKLSFNEYNNKKILMDAGATFNYTMSNTATNTSSYNMYINAMHRLDDHTAQGISTSRIYSFKIYNNAALVRDFIPAYRKSDDVAGLYDLVNNVFYTNANTSGDDFTVGPDVFELPSEYQKVEYIESTGTQYIDTGFIPDQDTKVKIDFEDLGTTTVFIFGARITYASNNYGFLSIGNGFRSDYGNNVTFNYNRTVNTRYLFVKNKNVDTLYYQGNQIATHTFTYTTITPNCNMYIFTVNNNGTPGNGFNNITGANIKLYSLKIYDDGSSLVRDFIPAYRTTDHVAGLYDLVNNVFYTNANTSGDDFTVGPDV